MKRPSIFISALVLVAACGTSVEGAQTYTIQGDQASPTGKKIQYSSFFPGTLAAAPGDTLVFVNKSTEAPHTLTFGVKADRSNSPVVDSPTGPNPAAFGSCFNGSGASTKLKTCTTRSLPSYGGKGYWNSGAIFPGPGAKDVRIKLADDIPSGDYSFVCLLHDAMNGVLKISDDRKSVAEVNTQAKDEAARAKKAAAEVKVPEAEPNTFNTGWGTPSVSYNEFAPLQISIPAGTAVKWINKHPQEPHTVTFESTLTGPDDPRVAIAAGIRSGSDYSGGFSNSGFITSRNPQFTLRFTKAGSYRFVCVIHPGMQGTVKVT